MKHPDIRGFFGGFRFLSNFVPVTVLYNGIIFTSVEHAYVAAKTLDFDLQQTIADIKTPADVKKFGRKLMLRDDWEDVKFSIMNDLLIQKFAQEPFKSQLLNTGDAYLEETNHWGDVIWGVCNGVGQNNLGHMLIHIRDDIRSLEM
jgi:ribA/ribD-fused uncharacterized protein